MKTLATVVLVLSCLLTVALLWYAYAYGKCGVAPSALYSAGGYNPHFASQNEGAVEGFANAKTTLKETRNELVDFIKKLTATSKRLANPALWKERIELAYLSPADLARRYIKQNKK